jgi:tol-pal system protein YbgF
MTTDTGSKRTMITTFLKRCFLAVIVASFTHVAWADDAPVYDVDSYPPSFDGSSGAPATPAQAGPMQQPVPTPMAANTPRPMVSDSTPDSGGGDTSMPPQPAQMQPQTPAYMPGNENLSLDQRVGKLEQQVTNTQRTQSPAKVEEMQAQLQTLRGQVDELNHQLQVLQTQQKSQYTDLDKRLSQKGASTSVVPSPSSDEASAETDSTTPAGAIKSKTKPKARVVTETTTKTVIETPPLATASNHTTASDQPNSAEEQEIYQTAYGQIKAKKYSDAAETLQKMLQKYPSGQFAANAHYWLGELYGLMGKNEQAVTEFTTVVKNYPDSSKIADAQLKLGLLYAAQFKWPDAKTSFKKVIANYPGTASARLASEQLKQIKQTGH